MGCLTSTLFDGLHVFDLAIARYATRRFARLFGRSIVRIQGLIIVKSSKFLQDIASFVDALRRLSYCGKVSTNFPRKPRRHVDA